MSQLEHNPLRPAVYVDALVTALAQMPMPAAVRQGWLSLMSGALGQELDIYYRQLCVDLRAQGVGAIKPAQCAAGGEHAGEMPQHHALTFERLRELPGSHAGATCARRIAHLFHPEFVDTVHEAPLEAADNARARCCRRQPDGVPGRRFRRRSRPCAT